MVRYLMILAVLALCQTSFAAEEESPHAAPRPAQVDSVNPKQAEIQKHDDEELAKFLDKEIENAGGVIADSSSEASR